MQRSGFLKDYDKMLPWFINIITVLYLVIVLNISYWTDIRFTNMFGLNDWLLDTFDDYPIFWVQMFREASPTEYIQWNYLGISILLCLGIFILKLKAYSRVPWAWVLFVTGFSLMFMEDSFNLRHRFYFFVAENFFHLERADAIYDFRRTYIELGLYSTLALIMGIAFILILKDKNENKLGKKFMVVGYLFYGFAGFASASRFLGDYWYVAVGRAVLVRIYPENWIPLIKERDIYGKMFMDYLVEESLELLGAALLLAALTVFGTSVKKSSEPAVEESELSEHIADAVGITED